MLDQCEGNAQTLLCPSSHSSRIHNSRSFEVSSCLPHRVLEPKHEMSQARWFLRGGPRFSKICKGMYAVVSDVDLASTCDVSEFRLDDWYTVQPSLCSALCLKLNAVLDCSLFQYPLRSTILEFHEGNIA